jgi:hypothetical protein
LTTSNNSFASLLVYEVSEIGSIFIEFQGNIRILTCSGFQLQTPISLYFSNKELVEDGLFLGERFVVCIFTLKGFLVW